MPKKISKCALINFTNLGKLGLSLACCFVIYKMMFFFLTVRDTVFELNIRIISCYRHLPTSKASDQNWKKLD